MAYAIAHHGKFVILEIHMSGGKVIWCRRDSYRYIKEYGGKPSMPLMPINEAEASRCFDRQFIIPVFPYTAGHINLSLGSGGAQMTCRRASRVSNALWGERNVQESRFAAAKSLYLCEKAISDGELGAHEQVHELTRTLLGYELDIESTLLTALREDQYGSSHGEVKKMAAVEVDLSETAG
ncbi:hypothetical protein CONPUDRAFT_74400 [Coniophora puteana RWD-64-598 SS2]|uniref:Uncharacterized protein n=1 Tax=Coniophora puteana (strain RWD-64-598) TaxID=741705 RepID=A0A5M3MHT8_CONPW|nr:uncharacterized protein CONPUDRAFT_74400 [Coniophora puteana RWD-64-598 SS2]EIW78799.1 hypothetical protein CONPUDRAFT_74400 [Coniophora puteana RWD-64-598 SS2]